MSESYENFDRTFPSGEVANGLAGIKVKFEGFHTKEELKLAF